MDRRIGRAAFVLLLGLLISVLAFCDGKPNSQCRETERQVLLTFKNDLIDPSGRLSSWRINDKDCCQWAGVSCDNSTGHVQELHLQNPDADFCDGMYDSLCRNSTLSGKINPSLVLLKNLSHLDLSYNDFQGLEIPSFLGSLINLQVLDLSKAGFGGLVPQQLGNLSGLLSLSLQGRAHVSISTLWVQDLRWVSSLRFLQYLDLSYVDLSKASDWEGRLNMLPDLEELYLSGCNLKPGISLITLNNFTSLSVLDLSSNNFGNSLPVWILGSSGLESLSLKQIGISGRIPSGLKNMSNLRFLDLSFNNLDSHIPEWIGNLSSLLNLDLSSNLLSGTLPESLGRLSKLAALKFADNMLEGIVSEVHFANLTNLRSLYAPSNSLSLQVRPDWKPVFQLQQMELRSWKLGPKFPSWLQFQSKLIDLDLSCTEISDSVPSWFWDLSAQFVYLNMSHNELYGEVPDIAASMDAFHSVMYLNFNKFNGSLPSFPPNLRELDVSRNLFSGNVSHFLCDKQPHELMILNLEENLFSGNIPNCLTNWRSLEVLMLGNNNFTGNIPESIGLLQDLRSLHLRNNSITGYIPSSLQKCKNLTMIDLSRNKFVGNIPSWIGKMLPKVMVLILRSNKISSEIPHDLCELVSLRILDMSNNNLYGKIPKCFNNLSAMASVRFSNQTRISYAYYGGETAILENAFLVTKGSEFEYDSILALMIIIDLSSNDLSGEIPEEVTSLEGLRALNLSYNHLSGAIPKNISTMGLVESLDLSSNQLSGKIPSSIVGLRYLSYLNVSFNELSGEIPKSTQLQSFNAASFMGNKLCGPPLDKDCAVESSTGSGSDKQDEDEDESEELYISMAVGCVVGFWVLVGPLLYSRSWRYKYYRFLDIWCGV